MVGKPTRRVTTRAVEGAPPRNLSRLLSAIAFSYFTYFFASVTVLHFLRTDCDPTTETVSQYAIGPYGYLMTSAFLSLGPSVSALAFGLWRYVTPRPRYGSLFLAAAGFCVLLVAVFPVDPGSDAMPASEATHDAAFMASWVFTTIAMVILTGHFKQDVRWHLFRPVSLALSVVAVVGLISFAGSFDTSWRGAVQRVCIFVILLWLMLVATRLFFIGPSRLQGCPPTPD